MCFEKVPCMAIYIYIYIYSQNGGLEQLLDDVRFVLNLSINVENLHFLCFWNTTCMRKIGLACACIMAARTG